MRELLVATTNKKKYSEIIAGLAGLSFDIVGLDDIRIGAPVEERAETLEGNAIIKAFVYGKRAGKLTLAEDSGLEVDALGGRPGAHSARYGTSDDDRNTKLLAELAGIPEIERRAKFRTVVAIYDPEHDDKLVTCDGSAPGRIIMEPKGTNGFGYDPIFFYEESGKTGGEMSTAEKLQVSHRGRALIKAREILAAEFLK